MFFSLFGEFESLKFKCVGLQMYLIQAVYGADSNEDIEAIQS